MDHGDKEEFDLLVKTTSMVLGKNLDLSVAADVESLREICRNLMNDIESPEAQRFFDLMGTIDESEPEKFEPKLSY